MNLLARYLLMAGALTVAASALAADAPPEPPKVNVPPPPPIPADDESVPEPDISISQREDATATEYRINGRLYMIKVKPKVGPEYYLVDDRGDGNMIRRDAIDSGFRVPRWVIKRF
ncbi:DUF2782 domain-containing protein [Parachitinimonas caeni]|uniref:DUF2782 domain-containing protein n=1 Tax=Parachitinimonas caeni TaxID=3031301 RepID=A0ABT7DY63_9NEIS|nr:DUF2782 domain-containing protein [Parachitinimonas caeni]MDK2124976.1 DUF2782 domain-containing protein [Parachitinimonas caeni]